MPYLVAVLIFVALSAACWFVSVAMYKNTIDDTTLTASPDYTTTTAVAVGAAALTSFIPFPGGYVAGLVVWTVAAFGGLGLNTGRAAVLFAYLALTSLLARFVVLGVMSALGG